VRDARDWTATVVGLAWSVGCGCYNVRYGIARVLVFVWVRGSDGTHGNEELYFAVLCWGRESFVGSLLTAVSRCMFGNRGSGGLEVCEVVVRGMV
jgi:hypothetical protein